MKYKKMTALSSITVSIHDVGATPEYGGFMTNTGRKFYVLLVLCSLFILLSSCIVPEKFDVKINVNKDGTFSFVYDGILTYILAQAASVDGSLSAQDERELKAMGDQEFKKDSHFKKVKYIGKGRYEVLYKEEGPLRSQKQFFDLFTITPLKGNKVAIKSIKLSAQDIQQFEQLKMKIDGTIEVKTNGKVLENNGKKSFFGFGSSYSWRIKSPNDPAPQMLIQLN